jgi:hypothetical protein
MGRFATLAAALLLVASGAAAAGDAPAPDRGRRSGGRPDVDVVVPVDPYEHDRLHWFDGRPHGLVPRVVAVNKAPYVCDADRQRFTTEDDFLYHLRSAHRLGWDDIADGLVVHDGQVHYLRRK